MSDEPIPVTIAAPVPIPVRMVDPDFHAELAGQLAQYIAAAPAPLAAPNNLQYVIAVVVMMVLGVVGVVATTMIRPHDDNTVLIGLLLGFLAPTTLSLLAFMKSQETHLSVNSRLDQFIRNAAIASRAQGLLDGRSQGRADADGRTDTLQAATDARKP